MSVEQPARPVALTVAGSDSGGGAGIQADLRTFACLGVFGTSAITAVTAQNLAGVRDVVAIPPASVRAEIEAVVEGFPLRAVKTGMLWSAAIVEEVAALVAAGALPAPVVDPVMVATSGARLLEADAVAAYESLLFPRARVITPNLDEAALLLGDVIAADGLEAAARALADRYACPVLLKGGHAEGDPVDVLCLRAHIHVHRNERVAVLEAVATPARALSLDDHARNVVSARSLGISALQLDEAGDWAEELATCLAECGRAV